MRTLLKIAVLPVALAAGSLVSVLAPRADAVVPSEVTGTYAGKVAFKLHPMSGVLPAAKGSDTVDATILLNPPDLFVNLAVHAEGGEQLYTLVGTYGLGRFHATGGGPGGQTTIAGKATGADGKVKLAFTGFTLTPESVTELKFTLKEQPPL